MKFKSGIGLSLALLAVSGIAFGAAATAAAEKAGVAAPVVIDARKATAPPVPLDFPVGGSSPDGHALGANSRYLTLDGKPWFPVMGEFHFTRFSEAHWEEEILKMKAGGVGIISTYVFWIHHEEIEGRFEWSGRRDLRRFVELCAKHGLYVWIRVGPWAHGESRNGGFPDWLMDKRSTRQNDPEYLSYVRRFYGEIGQQVKGLFWKDGGPIIGVQIENEYHGRGPGKGSEHMLTLLGLAKETGLDAPFYTATAWDAAEVPSKGMLPVFSGYADAFWSRKIDELPPNANFFFSRIRSDENVGDDLRSKRPDLDARYDFYPFLTAEMGAGMEQAYHRRPAMSASDTAAMMLVKLGSGVTLYGYYMFHGGTNPDGEKSTLQESQATGYPNDVPLKSYDFQAPLGEFGQINPSFRDVKVLNLFLRQFGTQLASTTSYFPEHMPRSKKDTSTPRAAARIEGERGFVFINNYQRTYPLPARKKFQVELKMPSQTMKVPRNGVDIPSGAYTIWPVNFEMGGVTLRYATAQLLCKLDDPRTYVFFAWPGIAPEFAFEDANVDSIEAPGAQIERAPGHISLSGMQVGTETSVRIRTRNQGIMQIVVLSREQARDAWMASVGGRERVVLTPADVFFEEDRVHVRASDPSALKLGIFPKLEGTPTGFMATGKDGIFEQYETHVRPESMAATVEQVKEANPQPPVRMGKEVAAVPGEADFEGAARWSIHIPVVKSPAVKNVFLRLSYEGDIARIYSGGKLLTDDFFKGTPWTVGLDSIMSREADPELELRILPLRQDAPIYLPAGTRPVFPASGEVARLGKVLVIPEYEAVADLKSRQ
jgi:beta-galactosidase